MGDFFWMVRGDAPEEQFDVNEVYADVVKICSLAVHHGGEFVTSPEWSYVNGRISFVDFVDVEALDQYLLEEMVKKCGPYPPDMVFYFHYKVSNISFQHGLIYLENVSDFRQICNHVREGVKLVDVYVEHVHSKILNLELKDDVEVGYDVGNHSGYSSFEDDVSTDKEMPSSQAHDEVQDEETGEEDDDDWDYVVDDEIGDDLELDLEEFRNTVVSEDYINYGSDLDSDDAIDPIDMSDTDSYSDSENPGCKQKSLLRRIRKKGKKRSSLDLHGCPFFVGQSVDDKEVIKKMVKEYSLKTRRQLFISKNDKFRVRVVCVGGSLDGIESEGHDCKSNIESMSGPQEVNEAGLTFNKDKSKRLKRPRKKAPTPTCPWVLHCSRSSESHPFIVKTFNNDHNCLQTRDLGLYTMGFMAREIQPILETNPTIPIQALHQQLQKSNQVSVSLQKVFRAKTIAQKRLFGDFREQYSFLREYCEEILRTNPGSTVKIDVEPVTNSSSNIRQFRRIYVCYQALKVGYKLCGRELMGLDGAFMKGPYPGQILSAVGIDANNGIFPVAFALVEAETYSSWLWFLELLSDDLDWNASSSVTFVTDRQKGLIPALAKVFPQAEHRYCLRHIHENMKKKWNGVVFKNLLWNAATATHKAKYLRAMEEIKKADEGLHKWLVDIPAVHWSRSHFTGIAKSDVLLNNLCEVFNKQLVGARDKPIFKGVKEEKQSQK